MVKNKTDRIGVRLEPKVKTEARKLADKAGMKLSQWIRYAVVERVEREIVRAK